MTPVIDSHQHFWIYTASEYGWIDEQMHLIRRDFLPSDLQQEMQRIGATRSVAVQARQTLEETAWLLNLAHEHHSIAGVVGWAPLAARDPAKHIERLAANPILKGVRHVLQDEPDDNYILRSDFNTGIKALHRFNLVYDILIFGKHLPQTIEFVDRHLDQIFVLDHLAKPHIGDHALMPWRDHLTELARRPNVYCKISGLITEADWKTWQPQDLQPYLDVVLEAFTPARLMFGSDWPVILVAGSYDRWFQVVQNAISKLSQSEQSRIWAGTAAEVYRIR
jgi:L-fuconolactonase